MLVVNPVTGKLDVVNDADAYDGVYLKLDQTASQNVINGAPQFDEGITIKEDKKVYLDGI